MEGIGRYIRKYRDTAGMTQEMLAEKVDISCNYLSAIEREVKTPKLETLVNIINALNVSADEVLQDVICAGTRVKTTMLDEKLNELDPKSKRKILRVLEVLIEEEGK